MCGCVLECSRCRGGDPGKGGRHGVLSGVTYVGSVLVLFLLALLSGILAHVQ